MLTATIPEHEQKHVPVSVKGNQLVLSGYRRNEEKLELEPGRSQGTNAFQSFLETFPITWPVDANKMTREFEGISSPCGSPRRTTSPTTRRRKPRCSRRARAWSGLISRKTCLM